MGTLESWPDGDAPTLSLTSHELCGSRGTGYVTHGKGRSSSILAVPLTSMTARHIIHSQSKGRYMTVRYSVSPSCPVKKSTFCLLAFKVRASIEKVTPTRQPMRILTCHQARAFGSPLKASKVLELQFLWSAGFLDRTVLPPKASPKASSPGNFLGWFLYIFHQPLTCHSQHPNFTTS